MANGLIDQLEGLARGAAEFGCALAVFGLSQSGKVFRYWPTSDPTGTAVDAFDASTAALKEQYDTVDTTIFNTCNTVQQAVLASTFAALTPGNWTPRSLLQSGVNLARLGLGQAVQLIPGGTVGVGGPPEGWGPVNPADGARLSYGD